jgi:hypothetical protein
VTAGLPDQRQAAERIWPDLAGSIAAALAAAREEARAEEAARWQAKIEALVTEHERARMPIDPVLLRALLDGER